MYLYIFNASDLQIAHMRPGLVHSLEFEYREFDNSVPLVYSSVA